MVSKTDSQNRVTIFLDDKVYVWIRREKQQSGLTYGEIVRKLVISEAKRRKHAR